MMVLGTTPVVIDSNTVRVHWTTGYRNHGIVDVAVGEDVEDRDAVAELVAIRFLIFNKEVYGRRPLSGTGYELRVFSGVVRKLVQRKSSKKNLFSYAMYLAGPLQGITVTVEKKPADHPLYGTPTTWQSDQVDATDDEYKTPHVKWKTSLGELYITRHAVEQFANRLGSQNDAELSQPMNSLLKALNPTTCEFYRVELAETVSDRKNRKYGPGETAEHWRNPESGLTVTILRDAGRDAGTLVTCFYRNGSFTLGR